jgi:hypothetical protein
MWTAALTLLLQLRFLRASTVNYTLAFLLITLKCAVSTLAALDTWLSADNPHTAEFILRCQDVSDANDKLHPHKNDGNLGLPTDYFLHASRELSM